MKKMVKFLSAVAVLAALVVIGLTVFSQKAEAQGNLTNGITMTNTIADLKAATGTWSIAYEDQSTYPTAQNRHGTIVRYYNFAVDGGAVGTIQLGKGGATNVPDNLFVVGGYLEIITPMTPSGVTNSIGMNGTTDILALSATNLTRAAGIYELTPIWEDFDTAYSRTNARPMILTQSGTTAATAGVFMVVLDVYKRQ